MGYGIKLLCGIKFGAVKLTSNIAGLASMAVENIFYGLHGLSVVDKYRLKYLSQPLIQ